MMTTTMTMELLKLSLFSLKMSVIIEFQNWRLLFNFESFLLVDKMFLIQLIITFSGKIQFCELGTDLKRSEFWPFIQSIYSKFPFLF